jgi:hypothetical protein
MALGLKPLPFGVRLVGVLRVGALCFPVPRGGSAREQKWVWPVGNGRSVGGWLQGEEVGFIGACVLGALAAKPAVLGG